MPKTLQLITSHYATPKNNSIDISHKRANVIINNIKKRNVYFHSFRNVARLTLKRFINKSSDDLLLKLLRDTI